MIRATFNIDLNATSSPYASLLELMKKTREARKKPTEMPKKVAPTYPQGLGTLARRKIDTATLGLAKPIAMAIAAAFGKNCRCGARAACLNKIVPDVRDVSLAGWVKLAPQIFACVGAKHDEENRGGE